MCVIGYYPETNGQQSIKNSPPEIGGEPEGRGGKKQPLSPADCSPSKGEQSVRVPNLNAEIVKEIAENLGLTFVSEKSSSPKQGEVSRSDGEVREEYNQISNLPHLKTFRKELRKNLTPAEATLWKMLKWKQLEDRKFRRQHSVGNYILDFYCPSEQIAIELDGQGYFEISQAEYDRERDLFLNHFGIRVLRFENKWVWDNLEGLLEKVKSYFGKQPLSPSDCSPSKGEQLESFAPIDILDYIYAVLHSPTYREKYKEFLKIDFPRVPYPKNAAIFWQLVKMGEKLRQIHLLESPIVAQYITQYPVDGDNFVIKPRFDSAQRSDGIGKVYINDTQYFDNVPQVAWAFYIGGYQPAQKWLKDRKDRTLDFDDIVHYQKIIVALHETDKLMKEIDKIEF